MDIDFTARLPSVHVRRRRAIDLQTMLVLASCSNNASACGRLLRGSRFIGHQDEPTQAAPGARHPAITARVHIKKGGAGLPS